MILFLEGQASQRDVLIGARLALPPEAKVYASRRHDRPEITEHADFALREPEDNADRIDWVISQAKAHEIKVILAGRIGSFYEKARPRFVAEGLDLVTGGLSMESFINVDDKSLFTAEAERVGLAYIPAITVRDADELERAFTTLSASGEVCIKPAVGIYGAGFWRFKEEEDPFRSFEHPDKREANFQTYLDAYRSAPGRPAMLVMPYLPGSECSIDMVVESGKVVAWVGRRKSGVHQTFERDTEACALAIKAAEHFKCDGLINVQTRDDADGKPRLLEINNRYSGGVGYTAHAGVNLPGIFATRRLGLPEPKSNWTDGVRVKAITIAVPATA